MHRLFLNYTAQRSFPSHPAMQKGCSDSRRFLELRVFSNMPEVPLLLARRYRIQARQRTNNAARGHRQYLTNRGVIIFRRCRCRSLLHTSTEDIVRTDDGTKPYRLRGKVAVY